MQFENIGNVIKISNIDVSDLYLKIGDGFLLIFFLNINLKRFLFLIIYFYYDIVYVIK